MTNVENELPDRKPSAMPADEATNNDVPLDGKLAEENEKKMLELSTKEAYFASLNQWVKQANISQNAMALFPYYLFNSYPHMFQNQNVVGATRSQTTPTMGDLGRSDVLPQATVANGAGMQAMSPGAVIRSRVTGRVYNILVLSEQMQSQFINQNGGYEHVLAPFWKRAVAEVVDIFLLLVIKLVLTFTIVHVFDLDLGFEFDKEVLRKSFEDDYAGVWALSTEFLAFSSDLLALEILTKILVCFYEAFWTRHGGATPGKMLVGLRIAYVEAMLPLQPPQPLQLGFLTQRMEMKALLYPAETPGFKRSFFRSVTKNLVMTLLFPMCFIMIFFKNNRTAYDIITKTIVIEDNPNSVLRHR